MTVGAELKELDDSLQSKIGNDIKAEDMEDELRIFSENPIDLFEGDDLTLKSSDPNSAMPEANEFSSSEINL